MKRYIEEKLLHWKNKESRKPLLLRGARQTGKTYSLTSFGKSEFKNFHYLNFQENREIHKIFEGNLDPKTLINLIEFNLNTKININEDLLFFDEIQDCPKAITSLKFFCENMSELAICCAGSLIGVTYSNEPFPVGKIETLTLYPMNFEEFLLAIGNNKSYDIINNIQNNNNIAEIIHNHIMEELKNYYIVGGLPEAVQIYANNFARNQLEAFKLVREKQDELITNYMGDFSKYSGKILASEISSVFLSIPSQLSRENKNFKASSVIKGGRFSKLRSSIDWLCNAVLTIKCRTSNSGELPFSAFTKENKFKLYFFDIGLLGALSDLSVNAIYSSTDLFLTFRGAFCENFVAQEFISSGKKQLYSYHNNMSEIEFLLENEGAVYPIEVKSGKSGKLKSLNIFSKKYKTPIRTRISGRNFEINKSSNIHNYPLYLSSNAAKGKYL